MPKLFQCISSSLLKGDGTRDTLRTLRTQNPTNAPRRSHRLFGNWCVLPMLLLKQLNIQKCERESGRAAVCRALFRPPLPYLLLSCGCRERVVGASRGRRQQLVRRRRRRGRVSGCVRDGGEGVHQGARPVGGAAQRVQAAVRGAGEEPLREG